MQIEIYYKLVLSSGASYKGSTIDAVPVKSDGNIIHLRDAVKLKNPNDLAHVDSRRLTVYASKADLDNKIPITRLSTPLKGLGKDEDSAVLVVVPDDVQQGTS